MEAAAVAKVFLPGPFHLEAAGPYRGRGFWALPWQRLLCPSIAEATGLSMRGAAGAPALPT